MDQNNAASTETICANVRRTALLVDDDIPFRKVIGEILVENGWDVTEASTGEDALVLLETGLNAAVLVSDIDLGAGIDGWALGNRVKNRWPDIALLFISGTHQRQPGQDQTFRDRFLMKPFALHDFLSAVAGAAADGAAGRASGSPVGA